MSCGAVDVMNFEELLEKYLALASENRSLKEENEILKAKLRMPEIQCVEPCSDSISNLPSELADSETDAPLELIKYTDPSEKVRLFKSLFRGRDDVYAKRWESRYGKSGYSPVCLNEWKPSLCRKPAGKCFKCPHQAYDTLNEKVIEGHLKGNIIIGIYPLHQDETCHFLAIDFDDDGWGKDTSILRDVCMSFDIPAAIERSRSGNGSHAWFFLKKGFPPVWHASLALHYLQLQ